MLQSALRRLAPLFIGLALFFSTAMFARAQSPTLDAPAAPLEDSVSAAPTLAGSGAKAETVPAKAYAVDYLTALRNLSAVAAIVLVLAHVQAGTAKGRSKKHEHRKSYMAAILLTVGVLLASQALVSWLYAKESREPGGKMHKTVPFGRTYFLY